jgi:protein SCO1/2
MSAFFHRATAASRLIRGWIGALVIIVISAFPASALTTQDYRKVGVSPMANAALPLDAIVIDESGRHRALGELVAKPTVLIFADYTCATLCGPIVAFVASALEQSGLRAESQFSLLVIGLDPKDGTTDAARMRRDHLGGDSALNGATEFIAADQPTVDRLTESLGYRYLYDRDHDQFIHPGAAYVLGSNGHVARVLTGLGLSGQDLRLALVEASRGRIGTIFDEVRLLCSGVDPTSGAYNVLVSRILAATGIATIIALVGVIGLLVRYGNAT